MAFRRFSFAILFAAGIVLAASSTWLAATSPVDLPTRLTDQEFWRLSEELSEPSGVFQSDNLLSNEMVFGRAVPDLIARTKPGGVYLGVGPEQNFTYIAAMKPKMVFITDIRRGNLYLQLMYKALFELSADRSEFVARLFTKPRASGLTANASAEDLMSAYWDIYTANEDAYAANLKAIQDELTSQHTLPLSDDDLAGIARVYRAFYWYGPGMTYSANTALSATVPPPAMSSVMVAMSSYRGIITQTDANGQEYSYLSSEEKFTAVKDLESRNLIVPVVGNFAGPKALRGVGAYIRDHGAVVNAFYLSNVESYLRRDGLWNAFCANVATFPLDATSIFIRPSGNGVPGRGGQTYTMTSIPNPTGNVQIRYVTISGGTGRSVLDPIAEDVKACGGAQ